jgi:aryl-alcohol dehydrogenase-like predicted oxidoreductase
MDKTIPLRQLGKSDLMVSPIGLGCWQFSKGKGLGGSYWPVLEDGEIEKIVRLSLEQGVNWFDTAEAFAGIANYRQNIRRSDNRHEMDACPEDIQIHTQND